MVLLAADPAPELMRAAMQTGIRDVVTLPLSLEQLESSARAAAQWSRALRERVSGEETAVGALAGNLIAVAGAKGGVGTTTVAIHLALAAARSAPGRPGVPGRLRPPEGRPARLHGHAVPAQRRRPRRGRRRDLRPPPAGDAVHAPRGRAAAARPRRGRARRGGRLDRRAQRARRGPRPPRADRRRPRRDGLRGERDRRRDGLQGRSSSPRRTSSRCAACGGCATCGGGCRCARTTRTRSCCSTRPRASARSSPTSRARSSAAGSPRRRSRPTSPRFEAAVNTGSPARLEDQKLRGELRGARDRARGAARRRRPRRRRRRAARPARPAVRRARPDHRRVRRHPAAAADRRAAAVADRARGLHVHARRPRRARGLARAGDRHDATPRRTARTPTWRWRTCRRRGARARRSTVPRTTPCACGSRCPS